MTISFPNIKVNDANVGLADVEASNGVVHVVDAVLLPSTWPPKPKDICADVRGRRNPPRPPPPRSPLFRGAFRGPSRRSANGACGASWIEAMTSCAVRCAADADCPPGQACQAVNCDRSLDPIVSKQILSMTGEFPGVGAMGADEQALFRDTILDKLTPKFAEYGVAVTGGEVTGQSSRSKSRRGLRRGDAAAGAGPAAPTRRAQVSPSSFIDVAMDVKGVYRPPPCLDMDTLIQDSVNEASQQLVEDLRKRSAFFAELVFLEAVQASAATPRPTPSPTPRPRESTSSTLSTSKVSARSGP